MSSRDIVSRGLGPDSEEIEYDSHRRFCFPMVTKICVVGGLYVLAASLMLAYSIPAVRIALSNILFEENNWTNVSIDFFPLLFDSFDSQDPAWFWHCQNFSSSKRNLTVSNGSLFLSLTDEVDNDGLTTIWINDCLLEKREKWLFVRVEIRLRCSDDNGWESGVGRGMRFWGLVDNHPSFPYNDIMFRSFSPESDPPRTVLAACSRTYDGGSFIEPVTGVDIREWHAYTILWRPGNATFLIDGEVVASTDQVPSTPLAIAIQMENSKWGSEGEVPVSQGTWLSYLDLEDNQSIEVDYVRVFMSTNDYDEYSANVSMLIGNVSSLIDIADEEGLNTTIMRIDYASFEEDWDNTGYVHGETYIRILTIMELGQHLDEISRMFREASEHIAKAREAGDERNARPLEDLYSKAEEAWAQYDHEGVFNSLSMIINWGM